MTARNLWIVVFTLIGVGLGYLVAPRLPEGSGSDLLPARSSPALITDSRDFAEALEALSKRIDEEARRREVLEEQLSELQAMASHEDRPGAAAAVRTVTEEYDARLPQSVETRLVAAGFTPAQIETIHRREGEDQMRRIQLDDTARREGWHNTPRYFEEMAALQASGDPLLEWLGADAYDRYLFTARRPNRVTITSVIETSPAQQAGLRAGDIIQSYAGQTVFSIGQFNALRSGGRKGEPVIVELFREGQLIQLSIPRGPVGVQGRLSLVDPDAPSREITPSVLAR